MSRIKGTVKRTKSTTTKKARASGTPTRSRARTASNAKPKKRKRKQSPARKRILRISLIFIVLLIVSLVLFFNRKNGTEVFINNVSIGVTKDKKLTEEYLISSLKTYLKSERGSEVQINDTITVKKIHIKDQSASTPEYIISQLKKNVSYNVLGGVLYINKSPILAMDSKESLDKLLEEIKNEFVKEGSEKVSTSFVGEVETKEEFVNSTELITGEKAREELKKEVPIQRPYEIKSNDTLYTIAAQNGVTVESILSANPGMTVNTPIKIGDSINITVNEPFLSVKTVEKMTYTEKQEKTVEFRKNPEKNSTYKKVVQQGRDGQKEVVVEITRINGFETEKRNVSEKITVDPITEIIEIGTK